ncbi:MAG: hypothetical protein ACTSPX_04065 [Candidatus Thorarchaeota archaeon]
MEGIRWAGDGGVGRSGQAVRMGSASLLGTEPIADHQPPREARASYGPEVLSVYMEILDRGETRQRAQRIIPKCLIASSIIGRNRSGHGFSLLPRENRFGAALTGRPLSSFTCAIQQVFTVRPW